MKAISNPIDERLIVALDLSKEEAWAMIRLLSGLVKWFKVGTKLFLPAGPRIIKDILITGSKVFLDFKFDDNPDTVAAAAAEATRLGVGMFTVHCHGGRDMMKAAVDGVQKAIAEDESLVAPQIVGVTMLSGTDESLLIDLGVRRSFDEQVLNLARLAYVAGLDGIVAPASTVHLLRRYLNKPNFTIVSAGIRENEEHHDQKHVCTAAQTLAGDGADYIVVGRELTLSHKPMSVLRQYQESIADIPHRKGLNHDQ